MASAPVAFAQPDAPTTPPSPPRADDAPPPGDAKPADAKPADAKPADAKPADAKDAKPKAPPSLVTEEPLAPGAPPADQVSGIAIDEPTSTGNRLRWIPRVLLFVPRWVFWAGMQPVRFSAWAFERYNLGFRVKGALFNLDQSYGIYPTGSISSDYGITLGARFVHYNLFGRKEHLKLRANFGGEFRQAYGFELNSGERVAKRFTATIEARYERRPNERFYGIGNADEVEGPPAMPLDPVVSSVAIRSRFREDLWRAVTKLDVAIAPPLGLRLSGAWTSRDFASAEEDPIAVNYDTTRIIGFERGVDNIYLEGQLTYDSRRPTNKWVSQALDATGWFATGYVGRAAGVYNDPTAYTRYGGEVQRYFDLYNGSRVLALRVLADAVAGTDGRTDGKISFIDLPRLGGSDFLRGYPTGRFRDRAVTLATAEYTWDLGNYMAAYTFVDAGRAWRSLLHMDTDLNDLRVSVGGGIQLHTYSSFITRAQLAVSRDGNTFFELAFSPAFGRRERAGKY